MKQLILFLLILPYALISQTNYYVSYNTGSDLFPGTSINQPWKTIQHACDNATPNSIINIKGGVYNEKIEIKVSGTPGNPIIFKGYDGFAWLDGANIPFPNAMLTIEDKSYITIDGFFIDNNKQADAQGILIEGDCDGINIINNTIRSIDYSANLGDPINATTNSQPLIVYGSDPDNPVRNLLIDNNRIHDCYTGYSEGLAINGNVTDFIVSNNLVYNISNIGIDIIGHEGTASANDQARNGRVIDNTVFRCKSPYATAAGIYVDGAKSITIERNLVSENQWGIEIGCEAVDQSATSIQVANNFIFQNEDAGIVVGGYDFPLESGKVEDAFVFSNSLFDNDRSGPGSIGGVTGDVHISYVEGLLFYDNIVYTKNSSDLILFIDRVDSKDLDFFYNLYYTDNGIETYDVEGTPYTSLAAYQNTTGLDENSFYDNPQYASTNGIIDLHLTASSPAIDAGFPPLNASLGLVDFDQETRVFGNRVDIGADEFQPALAILEEAILNGKYQQGQIKLEWSFQSVDLIQKFDLQKSKDGLNWKRLATIAANNSGQYEFIDLEPHENINYYRLEQHASDGTINYSEIISINTTAQNEQIKVFPNPVTELLYIEGIDANTEVSLLDQNGTTILNQKINENNTLDCSKIKTGLYIVCFSQGGTEHRKLVFID